MSERRGRGRAIPNRKPRGRQPNTRPPPKRVTQVTFDSSSDTGSDASDIPLIALELPNSDEAEGTHLLDIDGDERIDAVEVVDWSPKHSPEQKRERDPIRTQTKKKPPPHKPPPKRIIIPDHSEDSEAEQVDSPTSEKAPVVTEVIRRKTPQPAQPTQQIMPIPMTPSTTDTSQFATFQIFRDKKLGKFGTTDLTMTKDSAIVYVALAAHDKLNGMYVVSTERNSVEVITQNSKIFVGFVRYHDMNRRYTICSASDRLPLDDRDAELAGVALLKKTFREKTKNIRLVLRSDQSPHYPISKRKNLSRLAASGSDPDHQADRFHFFESRGADDSSLSEVHSRHSIKNLAIYDRDNKMIFRFFRSHDNLFTVSVGHPISPFVGFGIAISLIHSPSK